MANNQAVRGGNRNTRDERETNKDAGEEDNSRGAKRGSDSSNSGWESKRKKLNAVKYSADVHLVVKRSRILQVAAS